MNIMQECLVLTVLKWEFRDEKSGEMKKGVTVHYIDPASTFDQEEKIGSKLNKTSADIKFFSDFGTLPGKYNLGWRLESGSPGKEQKVKLDKVEFIAPVDLANLLEGIDQYEKRINNLLSRISQELPNVSDGKITKEQAPSVITKLRAKIPELAPSK